MNTFIGIDLGTTNSAICLYDGEKVRVLKSPEQNDVTPSAILIDRRGNKYVGKRAYDAAAGSPDNAALLFKRLMGSNTRLKFASSGEEKSPEECSAEVLKTLFGYIPEEQRRDGATGTVITVPAAFNLMQKNATLQAAQLAGIGKVALMQEPVAAVMSVVNHRPAEGVFLIFDLGGGTLDIAIAENVGGRVNLLANGGIQMCGGRDVDRAIFDTIVKPWLLENFHLPQGFIALRPYKRLVRFANWAVERAKIELSSREETIISLSEIEASTTDENGEEIYLDIPLTRGQLDELLDEKVQEAVQAARDTMEKAGLAAEDIERIVFIGGPTNYKPLRDKVSLLLGIACSTEVNPMTAVAEGAALFAESIDWESKDNARKASRRKMASSIPDLDFVYTSRTSELRARMLVQVPSGLEDGYELQVDSIDTGWTSGRVPLNEENVGLMLNLVCNGDNTFKVFLFDPAGQSVPLKEDRIVIRRTAATVDIIPASHSIGIAVKDGQVNALEWLVRAGDALPKKGRLFFKAAETLCAGSNASLNFCLWEGEIQDPITDNRPIGTLKVKGTDFEEGVIPAGAKLECEYEILDSGAILMEVSVPGIGASFPSQHNFYSRQEGQLDFAADGARIAEEADNLGARLAELEKKGIGGDELSAVLKRLEHINELVDGENDPENTQEARERLLETKRRLASIRSAHLHDIREFELEGCVSFFDRLVRPHAHPGEIDTFESLRRTAKRAIENRSREFEGIMDEMRSNNFVILWRQDWFAIDYFKEYARHPNRFSDRTRFDALVQQGTEYMKQNDIDRLRDITLQLMSMRIHTSSSSDFMEDINITRA